MPPQDPRSSRDIAHPSVAPRLFRWDDFALDLKAGFLRQGGVEVALRPKAFEVLAYLVRHHGTLVSKNQLVEAVWADAAVTDNSLAQCLVEIRRALGDTDQSVVRTVARRGYMFQADVVHAMPDPAPVAVDRSLRPVGGVEAQPPSETDVPAPGGSQLQPIGADARMVGFRKGRRRAWSWAALALAVVGTAGVGIWGVAASRSRVASVARGVRSIAVLPLRNLSDPSQANFADGMTEELIATLTQIRSLRVVSATSIMRYRDRQVPLRQIASDLGVDAVIDGTLQRDGDRVRVNAQLIDARTDTHLWAHVYDERLADVLALQSKLARAIASQVEIQLSPQETTRLAAVRTVNSAAYDEILLGQAYRWRQTEDLPRALEHYQRAVALDPQSAVAYAGLAATWTLIDEPAARAAARAAALRAVALDMELPEAHAALAAVKYRDWDWEGGDTESRLALAGSPGALDSCFCYGLMLSVTGRLSESLTVADEAILRNPLSGAAHQVKGIALLYARRYNEAEAALRRGLNVDPGFRGNSRLLAQVLIASGRAQEAVALLEQEAKSSALTRLNLAVAYASAGRGPEALQLLAQITASNPAPEAITVAKIHLALGDRRSGLQWLERSADRHEVRTPYLLQPAFDAIRREPRFRALVARLRFPSQFEAFEATVTPR